ncbi:hypothetical protein JG687_00015644 [Phytophthora cactorum]|uniref:Uncharacterized protein n=1 Tax=Phytophthora cactorum TaxID=29920 RepID=A0A8T1TY89_9STRA|nr:hypothetical protein GQ600_22187 [Phytophthora cactorum]KAG6948180.1 hypothetical protein JG687_00015644 [Phytophthora cactorum]
MSCPVLLANWDLKKAHSPFYACINTPSMRSKKANNSVPADKKTAAIHYTLCCLVEYHNTGNDWDE